MPHVIFDCAEPVLELVEPKRIPKIVFGAAAATELLDAIGDCGIKVRINSYRDVLNVDGHRYFVHVFGNTMEGRSVEQRQHVSRTVVGAFYGALPTQRVRAIYPLQRIAAHG